MWVTLCLLMCNLHVVTFLIDVQNHGNHLEITYYQGAISVFYLLYAFSCLLLLFVPWYVEDHSCSNYPGMLTVCWWMWGCVQDMSVCVGLIGPQGHLSLWWHGYISSPISPLTKEEQWKKAMIEIPKLPQHKIKILHGAKV
jgi:hypothetical protein